MQKYSFKAELFESENPALLSPISCINPRPVETGSDWDIPSRFSFQPIAPRKIWTVDTPSARGDWLVATLCNSFPVFLRASYIVTLTLNTLLQHLPLVSSMRRVLRLRQAHKSNYDPGVFDALLRSKMHYFRPCICQKHVLISNFACKNTSWNMERISTPCRIDDWNRCCKNFI